MKKENKTKKQLLEEIDELRIRLEEAEETLRTIRSDGVDALIVSGPQGDQVFTLRGAEQVYRVLIETMNEGAVSLNQEGIIIYCNQRLSEMIKTPLEKVIGASMRQFIRASDLPVFDSLIEKGLQKSGKGEVAFIKNDGTVLPVLLSITALQRDNANISNIIVTDLTAQKHVEEELKRHRDNLEELVKERTNELEISNQQLRQEITERKKAEEALTQRTKALGERVKELNCLYGISKLTADPDKSVDEVFKEAVHLIPPGWYWPEITCARIAFEEQVFITDNFRETPWKLSADIVDSGKKFGSVEVFLLEERHVFDGGLFLKEERALIDNLASKLWFMVKRKKAEEALALSGLRTKELLDMHLMGDASQEQFMDFALGASLRMTQSEIAFIGLMDEAEAVMTIHRWSQKAMKKCAMDNKPIRYPIAEAGWWGDCVRTRKPVLINDYSAPHASKKGIPEGHVPIQRFLAVPVFDGTRIVAVAAVANKQGDFTDSDIYAVTSLMNKLWEILRRKRAEQALKRLHHHNELILNSAAEGIIGVDFQGNHTFVNPSAAGMLGYEAEELLGKHSHSILHHSKADGSIYPEDECPIYTTIKDGKVHHSIRDEVFWRKDGTCFSVAYSSDPIMDEGKIIGAVVNFRDITERKQMEEKLQYLAYYDPLTDLPNRNLFLERINQEIAGAKNSSSSLAVVITDINKFKSIYDIYGSEVGDRVLKEVAERLSTAVRKGDTVAHLGNDEFGIICISSTGFDSIIMLEKIIKDISYPLKINGDEITLTFSTGISLYPHDGENASKLLKSAGLALSIAKKEGRKTYQFYSEDMIVTATEMMLLEKQLITAIKNEEFILHYQPYWDITTKKMVGMEALIRWQSKDKGLVPPGKFIPILEDTGMIIEVGEWILREAMRQVKEWQNKGHPVVPVSVNMSLVQFRQKDLAEMVKRIMGECGFYPSLLTLEITESAFMQDIEFTRSVLTTMKDIGCSVSIDDFGTGYSSLAYLKRFPIDNLKIDISFIREMVKDPDSASIVIAIVNMAHTLNLKTIAEGIETEEQWNFLRLLRCDMGQGFYLSKPLPAGDVERFFRQ